MERIRITELLKKKSEKAGRLIYRQEVAKAIYRPEDQISLKYLTYLLSAWDRGDRLGSCGPGYALRLTRYFKVRTPGELFEA